MYTPNGYQSRYYQDEAYNAIFEAWNDGKQKVLVTMPTGTGKTVVFSSVVKTLVDQGKRVLMLSHRDRILTQIKASLDAFGIGFVFEHGKKSALKTDAGVTVACISTMSRQNRLSKFARDFYDVIVLDEAHHIAADTYARVFGHFNKADVLGVTATPDRSDKTDVRTVFDVTAYEYTLEQAISDGYLVPAVADMIPLSIDIRKVRTVCKDFDAAGLGTAIDPQLQQIAEAICNKGAGRKIAIFCPLVRTAKYLSDVLNVLGRKSVAVDGNGTRGGGNDLVLDAVGSGEYDTVCTAQLLTEGWDCPSIDCIVVLRPTKNRGFYVQMVGRGFRPYPGKKDLLILDFLWLTGKLDLRRAPDIFQHEESAADIMAFIAAKGARVNVQQAIAEHRERKLVRKINENRNRTERVVNAVTFSAPKAPKALSARQAWYLGKFGISGLNASEAHVVIGTLKDVEKKYEANGWNKNAVASASQVSKLSSKGFSGVQSWTRLQASGILTLVEQNGWNVPAYIHAATHSVRPAI